ncbi:hypothetical protein GCM10007298_38710 [Williamsia phyllosphaerae]|uniref:Uncharacterized protein n=1 Tax=Williamsia phyllosphaerae TaxID=885042 RepID=A0ABQ1V6Q9_9NOCA|nr:hypothetical protein GCM10007298_38710 [Williamsia phyllosphaerae]
MLPHVGIANHAAPTPTVFCSAAIAMIARSNADPATVTDCIARMRSVVGGRTVDTATDPGTRDGTTADPGWTTTTDTEPGSRVAVVAEPGRRVGVVEGSGTRVGTVPERITRW